MSFELYCLVMTLLLKVLEQAAVQMRAQASCNRNNGRGSNYGQPISATAVSPTRRQHGYPQPQSQPALSSVRQLVLMVQSRCSQPRVNNPIHTRRVIAVGHRALLRLDVPGWLLAEKPTVARGHLHAGQTRNTLEQSLQRLYGAWRVFRQDHTRPVYLCGDHPTFSDSDRKSTASTRHYSGLSAEWCSLWQLSGLSITFWSTNTWYFDFTI